MTDKPKPDTLQQKLMHIQRSLVAPKSQYNSFGKYHYRNVEDILEALKPLLSEHGLTLIIEDEIVNVGDRYYIKATGHLSDGDNVITASAYAREAFDKKGMDDSQITGSTSSYARKYALNGLFAIDDTKDADTDEHRNQQDRPASKPAYTPRPTPKVFTPTANTLLMRKGQIRAELHKQGVSDETAHEYIKTEFGYDGIKTEDEAIIVLEKLKGLA